MPRPSVRPRLLDAAAQRVLVGGLEELTLAQVATDAGVSKGGLLYHFPTRAALLEALVTDVLDGFEAVVERDAGTDDRAGAWARAYVDATFDAEVSRPALAAALLSSPDVGAALVARCAGRLDAWHRRIEHEGIEAGTAAAIRYACDGWWTLASLTGRDPRGDEQLRRRLHGLIDEALS